jgi:hypothetical protein
MKINSLGTFTTATEFVPLFPTKPKEFKPLVIKRIYYEDCKTKTTESVCGSSHEAESRIASQNQQATPQEAEQADS